jgi:hypothetical protein
MQTTGHGNEALMILVPAGVLVAVAIILSGGPREAFEVVNALVGETARAAMTVARGLFS